LNYCDDTNIQYLVLWARHTFIVVCFNLHEEKKNTYTPFVCFLTKFIGLDFKPQSITLQIINPHISKAKKLTMIMNIINLHSRSFCIYGMLVWRKWKKSLAMRVIHFSTKHLSQCPLALYKCNWHDLTR